MTQRFLTDEDLPRSLFRRLQEAGFQASDVRDLGLRTTPDVKIFRYAQEHGYTLLSQDMGFSNILRFPLGSHHGIVVARFPNAIPIQVLNQSLVEALQNVNEEELRGALLIVEPNRIRLRRPPS